MKIQLIHNAIRSCFAPVDSNRKDRADRFIEESVMFPIVIGVGLANMHGFSNDEILAEFDIEGEDELESKLNKFSSWMSDSVSREYYKTQKAFHRSFIRKYDFCQLHILNHMPHVYFPVENFV